jgi:hypothetical protein
MYFEHHRTVECTGVNGIIETAQAPVNYKIHTGVNFVGRLNIPFAKCEHIKDAIFTV